MEWLRSVASVWLTLETASRSTIELYRENPDAEFGYFSFTQKVREAKIMIKLVSIGIKGGGRWIG